VRSAAEGYLLDRDVFAVYTSNPLFSDFGNVKRVTYYGSEGDDSFRNETSLCAIAFGNGGRDHLVGGNSSDELHGGEGDDDIDGRDGNDTLFGDGGLDFLYGGDGDDTLNGGAGDDQLGGGTGNDRLFGDEVNDTLLGGAGADMLYGGWGNDLLQGDQDGDQDRLEGDGGADVFIQFVQLRDGYAPPFDYLNEPHPQEVIADADEGDGDRVELINYSDS
jgi:Ca2+-binding RTX toxin-like protein